jgi:hypothetical protein
VAHDVEDGADDHLWPTIQWVKGVDHDLAPVTGLEETLARKYVLAGDLAILLEEDGDLIRRFLPDRPDGERIVLGRVSDVRPDTFLVLRSDPHERESLYDDAIEWLGSKGPQTLTSQREWKASLKSRLELRGVAAAQEDLRALGVRYWRRCAAWVHPDVSRPRLGQDFARLLSWLGLPEEPHLGLATGLLRARMKVGQRISRELESGLSAANLDALHLTGFMKLGFEVSGRSMFVAQVLAVSPFLEAVSLRGTRVPFEDWSARWLE